MKKWIHSNNNILDTWFIVSDDGAEYVEAIEEYVKEEI